MSGLDGKVAIITGATSGIGMALARALAAKGVRLVLTGRRQDRLEELAAELDQVRLLAGDITDPALPQQLVDVATGDFGRLDLACNNAGLAAFGTIESIDLERVAEMVRVNVEAAFRFAYTVLRHFKAVSDGYLINTSSLAGTKVRETVGPYAGTKHAIEAMGHALRLELAGTNVRVANIQPGLVSTEIFDHMPPEARPGGPKASVQPLSPDDIARAVVFMLEQPPNISIPTLMIKPTGQAM